ncbi:hypothetical protein SCHPADRAFT_895524 [Schizopora paradoxa]|uniref:Aminoglycoside phosphotransferase domain-containing protein n=1 Tax=Schizopora paradoxa TaxID=27342 RepID=A0A0H2R4R9_9AGAM|nr:hypothetical protein SCHPADRAFT_895524 [Schizopora paradoxa]
MTDDLLSVFDYDEEEGTVPDRFNLTALISEANRIFSPKRCFPTKIGEGGFHKVYDIKTIEGEDMGVVARVACPAFPKDKMESEVATLRYIAEKTSVPVPTVIYWNSDAANAVGAEYMFMSKVPGVSATSIWSDLPLNKKKNMIRHVAQNLYKLWLLRFDVIGSLYLDKDGSDFSVGPIVENHFVHKCDGAFRVSEPIDLSEFRGPFTSITSYLQSGLCSELKLYAERREDLVIGADDESACVEYGRTATEKAVELCRLYPGDKPLTNDNKEPISLVLQDFRLANIMIDPDTGDLNAFIDLEFAFSAPCWICAEVPQWLQDEKADVKDSVARMYYNLYGEGKGRHRPANTDIVDNREEAILLKEFMDTMRGLDKDGTWYTAYNAGKPYREFTMKLTHFIGAWGRLGFGLWVESTLRWMREHPGDEVPSDVECIYPDLKERWPRMI